jgi:hypothetical protein
MQEQSFFVFGRDGHLFSGGFEKKSGGGRNFTAGLPPPGSDTPQTLVGGVISSADLDRLCPELSLDTGTNSKLILLWIENLLIKGCVHAPDRHPCKLHLKSL